MPHRVVKQTSIQSFCTHLILRWLHLRIRGQTLIIAAQILIQDHSSDYRRMRPSHPPRDWCVVKVCLYEYRSTSTVVKQLHQHVWEHHCRHPDHTLQKFPALVLLPSVTTPYSLLDHFRIHLLRGGYPCSTARAVVVGLTSSWGFVTLSRRSF